MIKFYSQIKFAKSPDDLEKLATKLAEYYRKAVKNDRQQFLNFSNSKIFSISNLMSISTEIYNCNFFPTQIDLYFSAINVFLMSNLSSQYSLISRLKNLYSVGLYVILPSIPAKEALSFLGVPEMYLNHGVNLSYSFIHALSSALSRNHCKIRVSDVLFTTLLVAMSNYQCHNFVNFVKRKFPLIPSTILFLLFNYVSGSIIHEIESIGILRFLDNTFECFAQKILKKFRKPLDPLPSNAVIPVSLKCVICQDLLTEPKESLGFFFCSNCIDNWLRVSRTHLHPITGEKINPSLVKPSIIMDEIVYKYHKLALEEAEQNNNANK